MKLVAVFFKILFIIPFFRKRYFWFYKKLFKPYDLFQGQTVICRLDSGLNIKADLDEWIQQHIYFLRTWDERGINFLKNYLKKNAVFFDIGANIGVYSLVASKIVGPGGQVHSFEPVSDVFEHLQFNIELNGLSNITVNRNAVYQKSEMLQIFVSKKENAGMSSIFHHDTENGKVENVLAITIDEYVLNMKISQVDMIKIDIEGAELFALRGMQDTLHRFQPIVIMEISEDVLQNTSVKGSEVIEYMKSLNYEIKKIHKCGHMGSTSGSKSDYKNFAFIPAIK